ncbi:uncharacterized protein [Onthophagus taurus]|uniref:uncharacterized protein n=1 Tax=Onthophagus taurus TaxID=166361 RepID=UPI0039BDF906
MKTIVVIIVASLFVNMTMSDAPSNITTNGTAPATPSSINQTVTNQPAANVSVPSGSPVQETRKRLVRQVADIPPTNLTATAVPAAASISNSASIRAEDPAANKTVGVEHKVFRRNVAPQVPISPVVAGNVSQPIGINATRVNQAGAAI